MPIAPYPSPPGLARVALGAACLVAALTAAGCKSSTSTAKAGQSDPLCQLVPDGSGPRGQVAARAETVVSNLEVPWGIAFLPDHSMLVTERPGRVRLVRGGRLLPDPVATIANSGRAEGGLLGIAAHPDFATNRLFYVYVTVTEDGRQSNRVERWRLAENGEAATFDRVIFGDIAAARLHDGGRLRFGPDRMLYVGTGDATEPARAQDPNSPNGKLLRLTPEGDVPADNPLAGKAVFLLGIRNTEGFDWRDAGTLYLVDHGPSGDLGRRGHDEVNLARPGDNLGWPTIFGCETREGLVAPSLSWEDAVPPGGAAFYTGETIPEWQGSLLVGTLGSRHLHRIAFDPDQPRRVTQHEVYFQGEPPDGFGRLREVVMGPDGHLYVTTSNCDGRGTCPPEKDKILRILR